MRTIALLFFKPGELTRRYLAGQRNNYVNPLRLYLSASLVFFAVTGLLGSNTPGTIEIEKAAQIAAEDQEQVARQISNYRKPLHTLFECSEAARPCIALKQHLESKYPQLSVREIVQDKAFKEKLRARRPHVVFLMVPVFAWITYLLYRRRNLFYGEHLVFAFHFHAAAFFLFLLDEFLPEAFSDFLTLVLFAYLLLAFQRVFGGRIWLTGLRGALLSTGYAFLLAAAMLLFLLITILW